MHSKSMDDVTFKKVRATEKILIPLCEELHWHERDALDLFFRSDTYRRIMDGESVDLDAERDSLRDAGRDIVPIEKPTAWGCSFGYGIDAVFSNLAMFYRKYGVMPDALYEKVRNTKGFYDMLDGAWTWSTSGYDENFELIEKEYCGLCGIPVRPDRARRGLSPSPSRCDPIHGSPELFCRILSGRR